MSLSLNVFAQDDMAYDFVQDNADLLSDEEESYFEQKSQRIYDSYGLSFFVVLQEDVTQLGYSSVYDAASDARELLGLWEQPGVVLYFDYVSASFDFYSTTEYIPSDNYYVLSEYYQGTETYYGFTDTFYTLNENHYVETLEAEQAMQQQIDSVAATSVMDIADLLTDEEEEVLRGMAQSISDEHQLEVYILTIEDYNIIENSYYIEDAAMKFYTDKNLGYGEERDGVLLMLSMQYRAYSYITYGDRANEIYSDDVKIYIENLFLDDFANDQWYNGFYDFLFYTAEENTIGWFAKFARQLDYVLLFIVLAGAVIISLALANAQKNKLKSVKKQKGANNYIPNGGIDIRLKEDTYSHTTTSRVRISSSSGGGRSGGGGRSFSGGGFSGRSGKF